MRTAWCREHTDELIKNCGLSKAEAAKMKKASEFEVSHPAFADCTSATIYEIIAITDPYVLKKTLLEAEKILRVKKPNSSEFLKKRLGVREIRAIIDKHKVESPNKKTRQKAIAKQSKPDYLKVQISLEQDEQIVVKNIIELGYAETNSDALKVAIKWAAKRIADGM